MILTQTVLVKGKRVNVADLKPNASARVEVLCPECLIVRTVFFKSVVRAGHTVCQKCMARRRSVTLEVGSRFNMLTVLGPGRRSGFSVCRCDCGAVTEIENYNIKSRQKSCGCIKAKNFDKANRPTGENHGMWRGGVSTERSRTSSTKRYKDWRRLVLSVGLCKKCGATEGLQTHHLHDYKSRPELRTDPENGVALCAKCHRKFHEIYGRKQTTKEQFERFMEES